MRLLFFINTLSNKGGAEKSLLTIAEELANEGNVVAIAANYTHPSAYPLPKNVEYIEKDKGLKSANSYTQLFSKIRNRIVKYKNVRKIIREYEPDVIISFLHTNMIEIFLTHGSIPIISSERNSFDRRLKKKEYIDKYYLNRLFDMVTVFTRYDKAIIGSKLKHITVMPNALSNPIVSEEEYNSLFSKRNNILACGRIGSKTAKGEYQKGFDLLIKSFAIIADKYPTWDLDIAGEGTEDSIKEMKDIATKCNVLDRVHFLGFVKDSDSLMKNHAIYVLSSRDEGFGRVVIEAMANGCPVVSFDCSGPAEIITDRVDGILVNQNNVKMLAKGMAELMEKESRRYAYGLMAIKNVKRFSMPIIINKWNDMFLTLTNK